MGVTFSKQNPSHFLANVKINDVWCHYDGLKRPMVTKAKSFNECQNKNAKVNSAFYVLEP